jgi:hypothetical protein
MKLSPDRGLGIDELSFCRRNRHLPECRELLDHWDEFRRERRPTDLMSAVAAFRRIHGIPSRRLDHLYCYMAAFPDDPDGIEEVMIVETRAGTIVLAGADPLAIFMVQPLAEQVRQRGIALTLRLYRRQPDAAPAGRCAVGGPPNLFVFVTRKPDGHERTAACIDPQTGQTRPLMTVDPGQLGPLGRIAGEFRRGGTDIDLHRYSLECDVNEREILSRC